MEILNEHRESEVAIVSIDQTRTQEITSEHREGEVTVFTNNATPEVHLTTRREEAKATVNENSRPIIVVAENIETVKEVAERSDLLDDVITSLPQIMQAANAAEIAEQAKLEAISAKNEALESKETAVASAETALSSSSIALESANKAQESASLADQSAKSALTSKESASTSAKSASESMTQAKQSAQSASASASLASEKETSVKEYVTRAETASADAENAKTIVVNSTNKAETAERNAAASAQAAKNSENIALQSENKALASVTTATQEASRATEQASLASSYSAQALQASNTATQQATIATEQANNASQSATVATEQANLAKEYAEQAQSVDLSDYITKTEANNTFATNTELSDGLSAKQDTLSAGEGIKIEGNVISAEGGNLPDNVYTQENLLGGKNIEIVPEPVEGGIDEHTLAYWPFDGSEYDEVSGARAYDAYFNNTNPVPAVGTNCASSLSGCNVALSDLTSDWTIDGCLYGGGPSINFAWTLGKGTYSSNTTYITGPSLRIISDGVYLRNTYPSDPIKYADTTLINSGWVHLALQRKKDLLQAFVNGKKILETNVASDNISGNLMFIPINSATGHYIDNVRFSNVARYDGDFTPPTEPYTKAEPTGNKVINFTGTIPSKTSELENDSGFLTTSNLLGGKDIEIIPEPVEGGIDEYTLSCFHLDGTAVDEVTGYTLSPTMDNSVHKFGTGSSMWTNSTNFPWSLNSYESFSFDYWYYHKTSRSSYLGLRKSTFSTYLLGLYFTSGATKPNFYILSNKHGIDVDFEQNKWTHVYVYYNAEDRSFHLFVNGKEVFSSIDATDFSGVKEFTNDGYTASRFDEIRISKCIRWTEDFEPPTQPYRKAEPTGNYVINFTGKVGGSGKNIGEVYYSQSSLATDNSGALPLWTGESVSTAMYPSLTEWVTKHTELQCTAEEYESALSTYGECPKYVLSTDSLRLPKLANYIKMANGIDGITQSEAGLPNITGGVIDTYQMGNYGTAPVSEGALYSSQSSKGGTSQQSGSSIDIHIDASLSSEVYGKSETVTPAHTTLYPWVTAYTSAIEASVAQAAEFQQGLSGKADTNLDNIPTNIDYVVEHITDELGNWATTWKSGRLEVGGVIIGDKGKEFTFLRPFAEIPTFNLTIQTSYGSQMAGNWFSYATLTETGFTTASGYNATYKPAFCYYACGKGAEL